MSYWPILSHLFDRDFLLQFCAQIQNGVSLTSVKQEMPHLEEKVSKIGIRKRLTL